jgi:5-methylcytosine-specific restriction endonuclease McrA
MDQVFDHPIRKKPYLLLQFVRQDDKGVAIYEVRGSNRPARKAFAALGDAFAMAGGSCFYCGKHFKPQRLDKRIVHRDHVVPTSNGGTDHLHNLVIACAHCGSAKRADYIFDFRPSAARRYYEALSAHLVRCMGTDAES